MSDVVAQSDFCSEEFFSEIPSESESHRNSVRNTSENPDSDKKCSEQNLRNNFRNSEYFHFFSECSENGVYLDVVEQ